MMRRLQTGTESIVYPVSCGTPGIDAINISKIIIWQTNCLWRNNRINHTNANGYGK